jgi:phosphonate transport system ATP-binding protein
VVDNNGHQRIFRLDQVTKAYTGRLALSATSLNILVGERVAVVGPSGSGKTTLLHLLAGVIQPDSGAIELNGHKLAEMKPGRELSSLVGVIHQQYDLVPHLSVLHNVLAGRLGQWGIFRSLISLISPRDRRLAVNALEQVGLGDRIHERALRLSGGEQQRVAIARLLVQNPKVIIADEPVASLDPARAADLIRHLARIARESEKTFISSIHSIDPAREYFDRVIGLRNGELQFDLPVSSVSPELLTGLYELEGLESGTVAQD